MIQHENDMTNHCNMQLLVVQGLIANASVTAGRESGVFSSVFARVGITLSAFSAARKNRLDLSVGITLVAAAQIALFVAPVLVLWSYFVVPPPMDLQFWPGAVVMILIVTLTASLVTNRGRTAWFVGVLVLMVYPVFTMMLRLSPPRSS
jgi:calcium/proton exchanger cax